MYNIGKVSLLDIDINLILFKFRACNSQSLYENLDERYKLLNKSSMSGSLFLSNRSK